MVATPPQWIGRYRVHEVIGIGAFATVYRASDEHLDVDVAVKVLAENHSLEPELRQRFIEEGRRLRKVRSAHVVGVHELGDTPRAQPYLVMDLADRGNLATRVAGARNQGRQPTPQDARVVARAVAAALHVLHSHRLVHRDLTPKNLLLCSTVAPADASSRQAPAVPIGDQAAAPAVVPSWPPAPAPLMAPDEQLMVADLGLSKDLAHASGLTLAAGTSGFAPPEQRNPGSAVDHRSDIWAASALIVWLATDTPPDDDGQWQRHMQDASWRPDVTRALGRGLADRPDDRYPDISEWRTALDQALRPPPSQLTSGPTRGAARLAHRSIHGRVVLPLLWLVALLAGGAIGAAATRVGSTGPPTRTEQLDRNRQRTRVEDHGITITLTGPTTAVVDEPLELEATVRGAETWQWIGPDGALYVGDDTIVLTPRTAGRSTIRLQAFDDQARPVEATHPLEVSDSRTQRPLDGFERSGNETKRVADQMGAGQPRPHPSQAKRSP
jgi:serine/threonine protein kinase